MAVCQNLVPLVNIKIAGKWMFIPLKMVLIGIDPYPYKHTHTPIKPVPPCSSQIHGAMDQSDQPRSQYVDSLFVSQNPGTPDTLW